MTEGTRYTAWRVSSWVPIALSATLLTGVWWDHREHHVPPQVVAAYHQRVRRAAEALPLCIGPWVGKDIAVPPEAVSLLQPNVIVSRRYRNMVSGLEATLLLVQCTDARDLLGHYPPVCYVNQGWRLRSAEKRDWQVDDLSVHGTRYYFAGERADRPGQLVIDDFMVLASSPICRDMAQVSLAARDNGRKYLGAAQVQIAAPVELTAEQRDELVRTFVRAGRSFVDAVRGQ